MGTPAWRKMVWSQTLCKIVFNDIVRKGPVSFTQSVEAPPKEAFSACIAEKQACLMLDMLKKQMSSKPIP